MIDDGEERTRRPTQKLRIILYQCKYNFSYVVGGCLVAFGRWREARGTAGRPGRRWKWPISTVLFWGAWGHGAKARGEGIIPNMIHSKSNLVIVSANHLGRSRRRA